MSACWELLFSPRQEFVFRYLGGGKIHKPITDHRVEILTYTSVTGRCRSLTHKVSTGLVLCVCVCVGFPCQLPLSASIQTVFALCWQVGPGMLLRNEWVTVCLTRFKLWRPLYVSQSSLLMFLCLSISDKEGSWFGIECMCLSGSATSSTVFEGWINQQKKSP